MSAGQKFRDIKRRMIRTLYVYAPSGPFRPGGIKYFLYNITELFDIPDFVCYRSYTVYHISGIFCIGNYWRKWRLEGVLNFQWVLFSLLQGLSMKTYSRVYIRWVYFWRFKEGRNSAKIKPTRKIPHIRYAYLRQSLWLLYQETCCSSRSWS